MRFVNYSSLTGLINLDMNYRKYDMAYFQVLKIDTEKTVMKREQFIDSEKNNQTREVYETIQLTPGAYGHENIKEGDVLEINGRLAEKAAANKEHFKKVAKTDDAKQPTPIIKPLERFSDEWIDQRQQHRRI